MVAPQKSYFHNGLVSIRWVPSLIVRFLIFLTSGLFDGSVYPWFISSLYWAPRTSVIDIGKIFSKALGTETSPLSLNSDLRCTPDLHLFSDTNSIKQAAHHCFISIWIFSVFIVYSSLWRISICSLSSDRPQHRSFVVIYRVIWSKAIIWREWKKAYDIDRLGVNTWLYASLPISRQTYVKAAGEEILSKGVATVRFCFASQNQ